MFGPDTKFLIVDDFFSMRKLIKNALIEIGYSQIAEADDGVSALQLLEEAKQLGKPFDIIISDWNMPQMLGIDLLKKCRTDQVYNQTPFIMVTAEGEQKQIIEAIKNGCSEYIIKPFAPNMIKEKVARVYSKLHKKEKTAS